MKRTDFYIGLEFLANGGFRWRCTDIGTRTITAIRLDQENPDWLAGPPYVLEEVVFDEREIERCNLTVLDAVFASASKQKDTGHPGYPSEVVKRILEARFDDSLDKYPRPGLLRFDRVQEDGEILHPYAGRKMASEWVVLLYLPFLGNFDQMAEASFLRLRIASAADIRARADREAAQG